MTSSSKRFPIVIWRATPLDVETALWSWVADRWGEPITVVSDQSLPQERAQLDWGNATIAQARASEMTVGEHRLLTGNSRIHIFYGLRGANGRRMRLALKSRTAQSLVVIAERPTAHQTGPLRHVKALGADTLYRLYARRFSGDISAFLAMGAKGVDEYRRLGFSQERLHRFMYAVPLKAPTLHELSAPSHQNGVRFLYLGRLDGRFKGLDVLLDAVAGLERGTWSLDIVGGYGDMLERVKEFSDRRANVNYLGHWPAAEVPQRMLEFDVCIVPSRYDGWNTVTNQALGSGLAVIATEESTSDELVSISGAGQVIPADDPLALAKAMTLYMAEADTVSAHKALAVEFAHRISIASVGEYLIQILDMTARESACQVRPVCPWTP